jgi:hypothetical protein
MQTTPEECQGAVQEAKSSMIESLDVLCDKADGYSPTTAHLSTLADEPCDRGDEQKMEACSKPIDNKLANMKRNGEVASNEICKWVENNHHLYLHCFFKVLSETAALSVFHHPKGNLPRIAT